MSNKEKYTPIPSVPYSTSPVEPMPIPHTNIGCGVGDGCGCGDTRPIPFPPTPKTEPMDGACPIVPNACKKRIEAIDTIIRDGKKALAEQEDAFSKAQKGRAEEYAAWLRDKSIEVNMVIRLAEKAAQKAEDEIAEIKRDYADIKSAIEEAERLRVEAESARDRAEKLRNEFYDACIVAEEERSSAEEGRKSAEKARQLNESMRGNEFLRVRRTASTDHERAVSDHKTASEDHENVLANIARSQRDHERAEEDHSDYVTNIKADNNSFKDDIREEVSDISRRVNAFDGRTQGLQNLNYRLVGTTLSVTSRDGVTTTSDLKGEKGDVGAKGDKGDKGEKGDPGDVSKEYLDRELNKLKPLIFAGL